MVRNQPVVANNNPKRMCNWVVRRKTGFSAAGSVVAATQYKGQGLMGL